MLLQNCKYNQIAAAGFYISIFLKILILIILVYIIDHMLTQRSS